MEDLSKLLENRFQVNNAFRCQLKLMGLDEMAVYIRFNNQHALLLSTCQRLLISSHANDGLALSSQSDGKLSVDHSYYLGDEPVSPYGELVHLIKQNLSLHPVYCIPRKSTECEMVFAGMSYQLGKDSLAIYKHSINNFELFCIRYIEAFKELIMQLEPTYRHSLIFNNQAYLKRVIKTTDKFTRTLTFRERECLSLSLVGKSYKETARQLKISDNAVKYHYRNIREKLSCDSMMEAVVLALYLGEIGCLVS